MFIMIMMLLLLFPLPIFASPKNSEEVWAPRITDISYIHKSQILGVDYQLMTSDKIKVWHHTSSQTDAFKAFSLSTASNADEDQDGGDQNSGDDRKAGGRRDGDDQRGYEQSVTDTDETGEREKIDAESDDKEPVTKTAAEPIQSSLPEQETFPVPEETVPISVTIPDNHPTVILSIEQVKQQALTHPENLTFIENGIKLVIPTKLLTNRLPEYFDQFKVSMTFDGSDEFHILFFINETGITDWDSGEFTVYIPWHQEAAAVYCYQSANQKIPAAGYENGFLRFNLTKTGKYRITGSTPAEVPQQPQTESKYRFTSSTPSEAPQLPEAETLAVQSEPRTILFQILIAFLLLSGAWIVVSKRKHRRSERR